MALILLGPSLIIFVSADFNSGQVGPLQDQGGKQLIQVSMMGTISNSSYCNLLGAYNGLDSTNYTTNVTIIWTKLCVMPQFTSLIDTWGKLVLAYPNNGTNGTWTAMNLSFQTSATAGNPLVVSFVVRWIAPCNNASIGVGDCSFLQYWNGNVSSNDLTGPFASETVAVSTGPVQGNQLSGPSLEDILIIAASVFLIGLVGAIAITRRGRPPKRSGPTLNADSLRSGPRNKGGSGRSLELSPPRSDYKDPVPTGGDILDDIL